MGGVEGAGDYGNERLDDVVQGLREHLCVKLGIKDGQMISSFIDVLVGSSKKYQDDIANVSKHLEVLKDNELDLADQELNKLQEKLNIISEEHGVLVASLQEENAILHKRTEIMKDNELDLANSELKYLQQRWTAVFQAQSECITELSKQKAELGEKLAQEGKILMPFEQK